MGQNSETLWQSCLDVIKARVPDQTYETWFKPIKPISYDEEKLTVQVPSQFFYEWIENHYKDLLTNTLEKGYKKDIRPVLKEEYPTYSDRYKNLLSEKASARTEKHIKSLEDELEDISAA